MTSLPVPLSPKQQHRGLAGGDLAGDAQNFPHRRAAAFAFLPPKRPRRRHGAGRLIADLRELGLEEVDLPLLLGDFFELQLQLLVQSRDVLIDDLGAIHRHVCDLAQRIQESEVFGRERNRVPLLPQQHEARDVLRRFQAVHQIDVEFPEQRLLGGEFAPRPRRDPLQAALVF